jgi:hypothetical protein
MKFINSIPPFSLKKIFYGDRSLLPHKKVEENMLRHVVPQVSRLPEEYFASKSCWVALLFEKGVQGESYSEKKLQDMTEITAYRLRKIREADYLKFQMGVNYLSVFDIQPEPKISKLPMKEGFS